MKATTVELKGKIMTRATRFILLLGMILFLTTCASKTKVQEGDAADPAGKVDEGGQQGNQGS